MQQFTNNLIRGIVVVGGLALVAILIVFNFQNLGFRPQFTVLVDIGIVLVGLFIPSIVAGLRGLWNRDIEQIAVFIVKIILIFLAVGLIHLAVPELIRAAKPIDAERLNQFWVGFQQAVQGNR